MIKHIPLKINGRIFVKVVVGNMGYALIPYYEALEVEKELQRRFELYEKRTVRKILRS